MNKIFKNSFFNILQALIVTPIFFILVPYTMSKIGTEGYGLFALVGVISSYQVFVEMGLTTTIVRFVAKANVNKDFTAIGEYLSTALLIFSGISVIALFIIFFSAHFLAFRVLGIKSNIEVAVFLIRVSAFTGVVNLISGLFKSILDGLQRMDISNMILTLQVLLSAVGTFFVLESGYGLKGLIINGLIVSVLSLLANIIYSRRLIRYRINIFTFNKIRFKEMFKYGVNLQLSGLIFFWTEPLNKVLISHFIGIAYVGYYEIALKFSSRITNLIRSGLSSLFPASSEIYEKSGFEGIENLRVKSIKYIYPIVIILYSLGIICTIPFVGLWLGSKFEVVIFAIIILLVGSAFSILTTPSYTLLMGAGFSQDTLKVQFQSIFVNISCVIVFSILFGFYGFCTGYTLSMIYGFFATNERYRKRFDSKLKVYKVFKNIKFIVISLGLIVSGLVFLNYIALDNWFKFIFFASSLLFLSLIFIWKFKILTEPDIANLFGKNSFKEVYSNLRIRK